MSDSYNILDAFPISPIYGLLETASGLPGINDTGFGEWLDRAPAFSGARNFRDAEPGWALASDIVASFVPYVGWGGALNRAGTAANVLGGVNRARIGAASLFRGNAPLAFAAGETVAYAPVSAAITGFDLAGGRYSNPWDALMGFGLGTALGGGLQAVGHVVSPAITAWGARSLARAQVANPLVDRTTPYLIGETWKNIFEPGPQLSALYGFSANQRAAAAGTARNPGVQIAAAPENEPQISARLWSDIIRETEAGQHPDVDIDLARSQYDENLRMIINQEPSATDSVFDYPITETDSETARNALNWTFRLGSSEDGRVVSSPLDGTGDYINNPDVLAQTLEMPENWLAYMKWPRVVHSPRDTYPAALNLDLSAHGKNFRPIERYTTDSGTQQWTIRREADGGLWTIATEIPGEHNMSALGRYGETRPNVMRRKSRAYLVFKTDQPQRFFPSQFADTDNADIDKFWFSWDNVPRGRSKFLDTVMDFNKLYTNPATVKEIYRAWTSGQKEAYIKSILRGPTMGEQIMRGIETYAAPTIQQLKKHPEARGLLGAAQAVFDGAGDRARIRLYGTAQLKENSSPLGALFAGADTADADALVSNFRRALQQDPNLVETLRQFDKQGTLKLEDLQGTPAGAWLNLAIKGNLDDLADGNAGIAALKSVRATDAREIPVRKNHFGLSRRWDGSIEYPIYRQGATKPEAAVAGHSRAQAETKARQWIADATADDLANGRPAANWRMGKPFIPGESDVVPNWLANRDAAPGFLNPRTSLRGYEHEFQPYKHADEFLAELHEGITARWRYYGSAMADALTAGKLNQLRINDPHAFNIVNTRLMQLKGQPGPIEARAEQIVDSIAAPYLGTKSLSKAADSINGTMFQILHGMGNIVTPTLNLLNYAQTTLPAIVKFRTANLAELKNSSYHFPLYGPDGLARPGFNPVSDPIGMMWGGIREALDPSDDTREVFQYLINKPEMGGSLSNEYLGQSNAMAERMAEGIRGPEDFAYWANRLSSFMMQKSEQVSRTLSATAMLREMAQWEKVGGFKFPLQMKIDNAANAVKEANYAYFKQDRPMMFTTPAGAVFGNQKTWMTNYLFMMAHYAGLAQRGNFAPLLFTLGTTTALGGAFAVPLIGTGIDAFTETFADKDGREFIFEKMGQGGNAISFGIPALFGMSLQGNVAAPGSNLAHDAEFFFTIVALERAKLVGRALGRAYDDQVTLGINPMRDELFQRQAAQAFAPRAMYRAWEALTSDQLRSAATGYPMVQNMGWGSRIMTGLGFRPTEIAIQYEAYASLLADKNKMRERLATFGEAYANASMNGDRQLMTELLQQAAVSGLDINDIMRSAQTRMRNAGRDMFGRNFNDEQLEQYQATLHAGGVR